NAIVQIWNEGKPTPRNLTLTHRGNPVSFALSPDGRTLASGSLELVKLWDVASGREEGVLTTQLGHATALAFSANGGTLAVGGARLGVWDVSTHQARAEWPADPRTVSSAAWSADGAWLATTGPGQGVQLWDAA